MNKRYAVNVGINYPGTSYQLSGCVNDALDWNKLAIQAGYETVTLLDGDATKLGITSSLRTALDMARFGDRILFTYSGHGTQVADHNSDEADRLDEALVPVDFNLLLDDELHELWASRKFGVRVYVISDSCFSGTLHRLAARDGVPRFIPAEVFDPAIVLDGLRSREAKSRTESVLLSGCRESEVSYDAWFGGRANGAMTRAAIDTYEPKGTLRAWHYRMGLAIDTARYPQHPELQGTAWQRSWRLG